MKLLANFYACLAVILLAVAIMGGGSEARSMNYMDEKPPQQQLRAPQVGSADETDVPKELARSRRETPQDAPDALQVYQTEDAPEQIRARRQVPEVPPPPPMPDNMPMPPGGK